MTLPYEIDTTLFSLLDKLAELEEAHGVAVASGERSEVHQLAQIILDTKREIESLERVQGYAA